jgi:hypothetical protein
MECEAFEEMYATYRLGRAVLILEIGSFDNYIIPRSQKLKECGVLCVSSDEYLNYATVNHRQWEAKGVDTTNSNSNMGLPAARAGGWATL